MKPRNPRGRTPPAAPTPEEMARALKTPGLYILEYQHDPTCPAGRTGGRAACRCTPDVVLHRYGEGQVRR